MARGHVAFFCQQNPRVWEFLTASLEEMNSKRNREFENFANFGSRICEDLVYFLDTLKVIGFSSVVVSASDYRTQNP